MIVTVLRFGLATSVGDVLPGATVDLPDTEARRLIARGRAAAVTAAPSATPPGVVETRDPIVQTSRKGKR